MTWYEEKHAWGVKTLPKDLMDKRTTKEQWDKWLEDMRAHEAYCLARRPKMETTTSEQSYQNQMSDWNQMRSMDRPNEPGYYRAAND